MLSHSNPDISQKAPKIKKGDHTLYSRLISKDSSVANPSFRVYYGNVSSAVPFTWEIQPGTPKHKFSDNPIPPLTPPPSYYNSNLDNNHNKSSKTKFKLLYNLLLSLNLIKKRHVAKSSPSSLSSSSWSSSMKGYRSRRRCFASFGSSFDDGNMYGGESPDSVMCFGMNNVKRSDSKGSGTSVFMKKAFSSIAGRRSI